MSGQRVHVPSTAGDADLREYAFPAGSKTVGVGITRCGPRTVPVLVDLVVHEIDTTPSCGNPLSEATAMNGGIFAKRALTRLPSRANSAYLSTDASSTATSQ